MITCARHRATQSVTRGQATFQNVWGRCVEARIFPEARQKFLGAPRAREAGPSPSFSDPTETTMSTSAAPAATASAASKAFACAASAAPPPSGHRLHGRPPRAAHI